MSKTANTFKNLPDSPTLEDILIFLNGKKERMLLKKMTRDAEGNVIRWGTNKGEHLYKKLTELLFGIGKLTGLEKNTEEIVEYLDYIAESNDYFA